MIATPRRPLISYRNYKWGEDAIVLVWGEDAIVLVLICLYITTNYVIIK